MRLPSLPLPNQTIRNEKGERLIWLDPGVLARLKAMRGPGEDYSDVILRLAAE